MSFETRFKPKITKQHKQMKAERNSFINCDTMWSMWNIFIGLKKRN